MDDDHDDFDGLGGVFGDERGLQGETCDTCGSSNLHMTAGGEIICLDCGTQSQDVRNMTQEDLEGGGMARGRGHTIMRSARRGKADVLPHIAQTFTMADFVDALQAVLLRMVSDAVRELGAPAEPLHGVVGSLWSRYLSRWAACGQPLAHILGGKLCTSGSYMYLARLYAEGSPPPLNMPISLPLLASIVYAGCRWLCLPVTAAAVTDALASGRMLWFAALNTLPPQKQAQLQIAAEFFTPTSVPHPAALERLARYFCVNVGAALPPPNLMLLVHALAARLAAPPATLDIAAALHALEQHDQAYESAYLGLKPASRRRKAQTATGTGTGGDAGARAGTGKVAQRRGRGTRSSAHSDDDDDYSGSGGSDDEDDDEQAYRPRRRRDTRFRGSSRSRSRSRSSASASAAAAAAAAAAASSTSAAAAASSSAGRVALDELSKLRSAIRTHHYGSQTAARSAAAAAIHAAGDAAWGTGMHAATADDGSDGSAHAAALLCVALRLTDGWQQWLQQRLAPDHAGDAAAVLAREGLSAQAKGVAARLCVSAAAVGAATVSSAASGAHQHQQQQQVRDRAVQLSSSLLAGGEVGAGRGAQGYASAPYAHADAHVGTSAARASPAAAASPAASPSYASPSPSPSGSGSAAAAEGSAAAAAAPAPGGDDAAVAVTLTVPVRDPAVAVALTGGSVVADREADRIASQGDHRMAALLTGRMVATAAMRGSSSSSSGGVRAGTAAGGEEDVDWVRVKLGSRREQVGYEGAARKVVTRAEGAMHALWPLPALRDVNEHAGALRVVGDALQQLQAASSSSAATDGQQQEEGEGEEGAGEGEVGSGAGAASPFAARFSSASRAPAVTHTEAVAPASHKRPRPTAATTSSTSTSSSSSSNIPIAATLLAGAVRQLVVFPRLRQELTHSGRTPATALRPLHGFLPPDLLSLYSSVAAAVGASVDELLMYVDALELLLLYYTPLPGAEVRQQWAKERNAATARARQQRIQAQAAEAAAAGGAGAGEAQWLQRGKRRKGAENDEAAEREDREQEDESEGENG